jgi:hypothetical protein
MYVCQTRTIRTRSIVAYVDDGIEQVIDSVLLNVLIILKFRNENCTLFDMSSCGQIPKRKNTSFCSPMARWLLKDGTMTDGC